MIQYFLSTDDFSSSNQKLSAGYFCDEDYIFLKIVADNVQRDSLSQSRKLLKNVNCLRLDPTGYNSTPQQLKFSKEYFVKRCPVPTKLFVYIFQNQLDIPHQSYIYQSGDYTTYGANEDDSNHNQSIIAIKWKNSNTTQQNAQLLQTQIAFELFIPDVREKIWRQWVNVKPLANSDEDDGEDSGNFTQPTIQTVNTSTATADTNGSGDDYVHFPYWSS